jgi:hypothetical protein
MHSAALRTQGAPERRRSGFNLGRDDRRSGFNLGRDDRFRSGFNLGRDDRGRDDRGRDDREARRKWAANQR